MKVAYFVLHYPNPAEPPDYFWGGSGEAAAGLAEAMAKRGHEATVFASSPAKQGGIRELNGVRIIECPTWLTVAQAKIAPSVLYRALGKAFDLVHAHVASPPADIGALVYSRLREVPLVATYHGDPQATYGSALRKTTLRTYQLCLLPALLSHVDLLYVPSRSFLGESTVLNQSRVRTKELPNGLRSNQTRVHMTKSEARMLLKIPEDAAVVLYLGSINPYKGPDVLLEAAELMQTESAKVQTVFVGEGALRHTLATRARSRGLGSVVRFEGRVSEALKPCYMAAADLLVLPSVATQEVFPVTILEAFASGLPVLVSDLRTFQSIISAEETGVVVPRNNPRALASGILRLLADEALRARLKSAGLESIHRYSWDALAREVEDDYSRLLGS